MAKYWWLNIGYHKRVNVTWLIVFATLAASLCLSLLVFLNWRNALVFHQPLNEGCVALIALTLNSFSLSCNSALGEPTLEMVGVPGAREDDGEAKDKEEDPSGGSHALSLRSFLRDT